MGKTRIFHFLLLGALSLMWVGESSAYVRGSGLFLYRPGEGYITHAQEPYKHWPRSYLVRPEDLVFDELGNFCRRGHRSVPVARIAHP